MNIFTGVLNYTATNLAPACGTPRRTTSPQTHSTHKLATLLTMPEADEETCEMVSSTSAQDTLTDLPTSSAPRRVVDIVDEGDVGCAGKGKRKKQKKANSSAMRQPADAVGTGNVGIDGAAAVPDEHEPVAGRTPKQRLTVEAVDEGDVGCTGRKNRGKTSGGSVAVTSLRGTVQEKHGPLTLSYPPVNTPTQECGLCAPPACCYRNQVGRIYVCCERRVNGQPKIWCAVPACWSMHLCTQSLILGISGLVFVFALPSHHWWVWIAAAVLVPGTSLALCRTGTSDPGVLPLCEDDDRPPPSAGVDWFQERRTGRAWIRKPIDARATWCQESQVLVYDYDHFCPWTGTTIAGGNMRCFQVP
eukprot:SAG31_NODE_147_length_22539_cov_37.073663_15_plen_360_part_00